MKIKSLLFTCCLSLMGTAGADNHHFFPGVSAIAATKAATEGTTLNAKSAGWCEIEIINQSYDDVTVYSTLPNGASITPFDIYSWEAPQYVSLYSRGYCYSDTYLDIVTFNGYHIYSGYTAGGKTVRIVPYLFNQSKNLANQSKAEIKNR